MKLYYDLHLHSCLSPCGDNDMTPYNLVHMAALQGMQMIALTDHNSCLNCPAAMEVGMQTGLLVIPGMELCPNLLKRIFHPFKIVRRFSASSA